MEMSLLARPPNLRESPPPPRWVKRSETTGTPTHKGFRPEWGGGSAPKSGPAPLPVAPAKLVKQRNATFTQRASPRG